ncbi:MAG: hypothetical protein HY900_29425 [Deltaproteobacteria bacterium]|nr:hypothetical protein [Deltaproteobacteria bacterium]
MSLQEELKALARVSEAPQPFVTFYLNTKWDSEKQRERVRIFVKSKLRDLLAKNDHLPAEARRALEVDAERIDQYVRGLVAREHDESFAGIAIFSCAGLGVHRIIKSYAPFEEGFECCSRPALRPALHAVRAGEPALLCMIQGDAGRLLEFEMGGVRREFAFEDEEFPGRHEQGGWSQARFQRHVREHLMRNLSKLAEQAVKWLDERKSSRILLSGPEADVALFESYLPKRLRGGILARLAIDPNATKDVVEAEVRRALEDGMEEGDRAALDELLDLLGSPRAITGPDAVAQAVAAGKVRTLYIDGRFREPGWKCFSCGALGVKVPLGCPVCQTPVETVELGEELVRGTLAADGDVVPVREHEGLRAEGGVAAALRYG